MSSAFGRSLLGLWLATALLAAAPPASADPTVTGSVTGELTRGRKVTFRLIATHPDGWRTLDSLRILLTLREALLEEIEYGVSSTTIEAGIGSALVGTGDRARGRFFSIESLDVRVSTGGNRLELTFSARLLDDVPEGARFEFVATDDFGAEASVRRVAATQVEDEGFPWGTLALAIGAALLAGGFLGSQLTTHRRPASRSIYQDVARRILEERERARRDRG